MANPWTGEVELVIDGNPRVMKLTLGALAELEQALSVGSLVDLVQRFESGGFSAADIMALIGAGLQGGGHSMSFDELAKAQIDGGPMAAARAAAKLLARAFMVPEQS